MNPSITTKSGRDALADEFVRVRRHTEALCEPLATDDYQVQSAVQTSPPKWHIAHVSWLFETFVLSRFHPSFKPYDPKFDFLFNSYYYTHSQMHPRSDRGLLSRPTVEEVYRYRAYVDDCMLKLMRDVDDTQWQELAFYVILGINHEEQHQELLMMDIKYNFFANPLKPAYRDDLPIPDGQGRQTRWLDRAGGIKQIGHEGGGFSFDNETPRHDVLLTDHRLADRFVTNGEFMEFVDDGGYRDSALWLSDGWSQVQTERFQHPLYWINGGSWRQFTLGGIRELNPHEPVCHLSFYEADAYARWAGKRLPLESELEVLLSERSVFDDSSDEQFLHPKPAGDDGQWFNELWAWTASPYTAYPGFRPLEGSVGEYNGKFMANQWVLRGGCCATPIGHARSSYRNFYYPSERWAFTGLRLAEDG